MPSPTAARRDEWTPERAERTAAGLGVVLGPQQWQIIGCVRELSAARGRPPDLATLAARVGVVARTIAEMFPGSTLAAVAGVHSIRRSS